MKDLVPDAPWTVPFALAGVELALVRATGGTVAPGTFLLSVALAAAASALSRRFPLAVPGVVAVYGLGVLLPGQGGWPLIGLGVLLLLAVITRMLHRGGSRWTARRAIVGLAVSVVLVWGRTSILEGARPPVAALSGGTAVLAAGLLLGPSAGILALLALIPAGSGERWTAAGPVPQGPDVVLVTIDTLRADQARSMKIFEGMTLAQSAAPWTLPSVGTLLTGVEPGRHGAMRTADGTTGLRADVATTAERFAAAGWDTACTAENPYTGPVFGLTRGFARVRHGSLAAFQVPERPVAEVALDLVGLATPRDGVERRAADLLDFFAHKRDRPLFVWVHVLDPHLPYRHALGADLPVGQRLWLLGRNRQLLGDHPSESALAVLRGGYAHEVATVDRELDAAFRRLPPDVRLLVTADHGEAFGEHGGFEHGHALWQELLSVPMATRGFAIAPGGLAGTVDVSPTLLGLAGIPAPGLDGRDLRFAGDAPVRSGNLLYGPPDARAVRLGAHKLIDGVGSFDLDADPGETRPAPAGPLATLLPDWRGGGATPAYDADTRAELERLGYVAP